MKNKPELIQAVLQLRRAGVSYPVITEIVNRDFETDKTPNAIEHIWRRHGDRNSSRLPTRMERRYGRYVPIELEDPRVLIIPDLHMPFMVQDFIDFLCRVRDTIKPNLIFGIGDAFDHHAISFWDNAPNADSSFNEYEKAKKQADVLYSEFPDVLWTVGNHDDRHLKMAAKRGIADVYMRDINEVFEMPSTWVWHKHYVLNGDTLVEHGTNSGLKATYDRAWGTSKNVIQGHTHSYGGVLYMNDEFTQRWALNVGCGIDVASYAAAYAESFKYKPTLGCGILINDIPQFIPYNGRYLHNTL